MSYHHLASVDHLPIRSPSFDLQVLFQKMLGTTMLRSNGSPSASMSIVETRIVFSEDLLKSARGAVKTVIDILAVAASMTQNVPYIGIVSGALAEFLKIQAEVSAFKSDWKAVMAIARQIKHVIDDVREQCESTGTGRETLPKALLEPFNDLERCLKRTLETLNACQAQRKTGLVGRIGVRAREYLNRGELLADVQQCRADMQSALDLFNTRLQIDQSFTMHAMAAILVELRDKQTITLQPRIDPPAIASLPPAPPVFYGRAHEVDHIVDLLLSKQPARVAILGFGGIGKTSIALTVLHDLMVEDLFGDNRFFMSCEISSADGVVQELLILFGLIVDNRAGVTPLNVLLAHLRTLGGILLCLDNLETPWDADIQAVETLLSMIAGIPRLALMITTRGADRPAHIAWTRPHLNPIVPLTLDAAIETWDAICDSHDEYSLLLIQGVDCVPLAVTLLAHLAQSETSEALWLRWQHEQVELLRTRGSSGRSNQVDSSIRLSLYGHRMQSEPLAVELFSVICMLPQGLFEPRIQAFATALVDILPSLRRLITLLKQCSLVYTSEDGYIRVLSPVRLYMQAHHPVVDYLFFPLAGLYHNLVNFQSDDFAGEVKYARENIQPEIGNISAVLRLCLTRDDLPSKGMLRDVKSFSRLCRDLSFYDTALLDEAISRAGNQWPAEAAYLWQEKGECLYFQDHKDQSLPVLVKACELHRSVGDEHGEAECLHRLGDAYLFNDRLENALSSLQRALEVSSAIGHQRGRSRTLRSLGRLYIVLARFDEAHDVLQSALEIFEENKDELGKASALEALGVLFRNLGEYDRARDVLCSALTVYGAIDYRLGQANVLMNLGFLSNLNSGMQMEEGESSLKAALDLYREINGRMGEVNVMNALGLLYTNLLRYPEAFEILESALEFASNISFVDGQRTSCNYLGSLHKMCGNMEEADRYFSESHQLLDRTRRPARADGLANQFPHGPNDVESLLVDYPNLHLGGDCLRLLGPSGSTVSIHGDQCRTREAQHTA